LTFSVFTRIGTRIKEQKMSKKLTITVDSEVYDGLHSVIGPRRISRFLNDLARPHVVGQDLSAGYSDMAADEAREAEAEGWSEGLLGDVANEPKRA
jgi:hypothetical protein